MLLIIPMKFCGVENKEKQKKKMNDAHSYKMIPNLMTSDSWCTSKQKKMMRR